MLLADFDDFFRRSVAVVLSLSPTVCDRAAEIRASYGLKTPDAIHLAAATLAGCDVFLTNDRRLAGFPGIVVEVVGP
jgi:predicted nucleic acid-binding protein